VCKSAYSVGWFDLDLEHLALKILDRKLHLNII
jgi:hypothetical protein